MGNAEDTAWIVERANELGFDLCGVAPAERFEEQEKFGEWLARGYAGEMKYLEDPRRRDAGLVVAEARSVIVCALNYNTAQPYSLNAMAASGQAEARGWISRYAWGRDYHEVMWEKLNGLCGKIGERFPKPFEARAYADTGPIAERVFAKHAGLGWLGKNTLLLNEKLGSWLFLGVIVTTVELAPTLERAETAPPDQCGQCRQCLDACPTGALVEPYVMDARRCISYLTIELREGIPEEFREAITQRVYGCDICQDVCPFNRGAAVTFSEDFEPRKYSGGQSLFRPGLEWLASMKEEDFREVFGGSAIKRTKWRGLVRNACIAMGNTKWERGSAEYRRIVELLARLSKSPEAVIAESAQWAKSRIQ
jgi:epoxyqueuosine reductase